MREEVEKMIHVFVPMWIVCCVLSITLNIFVNIEDFEPCFQIDFAPLFDKAKSILLFAVIPVICKIISFVFKVADILQLPVEIRKTIEQVSKVIGKNRQGKTEEKSALVWDEKKKRFVS